MTTRSSELKALEDRVQKVERTAFVHAARPYLLAYHIGGVRDPANFCEGLCKALGIEGVNDLSRDLLQALEGKKSTIPDRYSKALGRLLARGGRRLPDDIEAAIHDMAIKLPLNWQKEIRDCARNDLADRSPFRLLEQLFANSGLERLFANSAFVELFAKVGNECLTPNEYRTLKNRVAAKIRRDSVDSNSRPK